MGVGGTSDTVDGRNPIPNHLGKKNTPVNNQISTTNLNWWVNAAFLNQQKYVCLIFSEKILQKNPHTPQK